MNEYIALTKLAARGRMYANFNGNSMSLRGAGLGTKYDEVLCTSHMVGRKAVIDDVTLNIQQSKILLSKEEFK